MKRFRSHSKYEGDVLTLKQKQEEKPAANPVILLDRDLDLVEADR